MGYCDCKICNPDDEPKELPKPQYHVIVMKRSTGYWASQVGSQWLEIRGTADMSFDDLKRKVFTELDDVRAHPNSTHFDEEYGGRRKA